MIRQLARSLIQALAVSAMCVGTTLAAGKSTDIVKWVDQNGVTHFSEASFGTNGAQPVTLTPANSMDPPKGAARTRGAGPRFVKISKAKRRNKDGWEGHNRGNGNRRARVRSR